MPEYTLHDEVHLAGVANLMARLIPENVLSNLQPLELGSLILAAALHDMGMSPSAETFRSLTPDVASDAGDLAGESARYLAFREGFSDLLKRQAELHRDGRELEAREIEAYMQAEYLRQTHAQRSREFVFATYGDVLCYGNFNFAARIADVCFSHNEDPASLDSIPCWELVRAPGEYCNWRFIAVVLRLADILDFDPKRTPRTLMRHLGIRSPVSVREWRKHQAVSAWDIRPDRIAFAAQCEDPVIEKTIRDFVRLIERELLEARAIEANMHEPSLESTSLRDRYALLLPHTVDTRDIGPARNATGPLYEYIDLAFHLDEDSIRSLLMGLRLYADRDLFLRELLQNAVDACRHRRALHERRPELGPYEPLVKVAYYTEGADRIVEVSDNGMGMDDDIVRSHFARLGSSYYMSSRFRQERAAGGLKFEPVSQFGIGVLSVFMVGDRLEVQTLRAGRQTQPISIEIAGEGSLFWFKTSGRDTPGTSVRVRLDPAKSERTGTGPPESRHVLVHRLAPHVDVPIEVSEGTTARAVSSWTLAGSGIPALAVTEALP
jgi:molecular chaperone HtpG